MPSHIIFLTLFAALLHASWNTLLRGATDRLWAMTIMCVAIAMTSGLIALFVPLPSTASWKYVLFSALLHVGYNLCLIRSYQSGDLGAILSDCARLLSATGDMRGGTLRR